MYQLTESRPVPDNAVTTSNTDCGFWYTIQDGDMCETVASMFSISEKDFYFLNPQLNNTCDSLWLNNSYVRHIRKDFVDLFTNFGPVRASGRKHSDILRVCLNHQ